MFFVGTFCWPQKVLCRLTFDDFFSFNDFRLAAGQDGHDGHDEAALYRAVVRFLTKSCSRLLRDDFKYTTILCIAL